MFTILVVFLAASMGSSVVLLAIVIRSGQVGRAEEQLVDSTVQYNERYNEWDEQCISNRAQQSAGRFNAVVPAESQSY